MNHQYKILTKVLICHPVSNFTNNIIDKNTTSKSYNTNAITTSKNIKHNITRTKSGNTKPSDINKNLRLEKSVMILNQLVIIVTIPQLMIKT